MIITSQIIDNFATRYKKLHRANKSNCCAYLNEAKYSLLLIKREFVLMVFILKAMLRCKLLEIVLHTSMVLSLASMQS